MVPAIRSVAIITKINSTEAEEAAARITTLLKENKTKVYTVFPLKTAGGIPVRLEELEKLSLDLVFAIGGDGTTLRAFRAVVNTVPLISMNIGGHRGVLADMKTGSVDTAVKAIFAGKYSYDPRIRIQASLDGFFFPPALNDILVIRSSLTRTPTFSIRLMGDEIKQRMDGMVISTPTGSTGHSYSTGGPVLHEGLSCLILSPIASVNRMPQLVIPIEEVVIKSTHESNLVVDGQESFKVEAAKEIRIGKFPDNARFLRLEKKGMRQLVRLGF